MILDGFQVLFIACLKYFYALSVGFNFVKNIRYYNYI